MIKKFLFLMVLLPGCSSVPYSIDMVNVYDTLPVRRGEFEGCEILVRNVDTLVMGRCGSLVDGEQVCGVVDCPGVEELSYKKLKCLPFEDVRLDRPVSHPRNEYDSLQRRSHLP